MDRIVLEVDDNVGKLFRNFNQEKKQIFTQAISVMIKKAVNDANSTERLRLLDSISDEASKNGLTPELLEELLASDD